MSISNIIRGCFFFLTSVMLVGCTSPKVSDTEVVDYFRVAQSFKKNRVIIKKDCLGALQTMGGHIENHPSKKVLLDTGILLYKYTNELSSSIDSLIESFLSYSGITGNEVLSPVVFDKLKNKTLGYKFFCLENEDKITKKDLLFNQVELSNVGLLDAVNGLWEKGGTGGTIMDDPSKKEVFMMELMDNLKLPKVIEQYKDSSGKNSWKVSLFKDVSVAEILAMLRKIQNDILLDEYFVLNELVGQCNIWGLRYEKLGIQLPLTPFVRKGAMYEAEIMLGKLSKDRAYSVSIDGQDLEIVDGEAKYEILASTIGKHKYNVLITVYTLLGEVDTIINREFSYKVIPQ